MKETEIGPLPEDWAVVELGEHTSWFSGGTPRLNNPAYWGGAIPWVSAKDMKRTRLSDAQMKVTPAGARAGSRLMPVGTILVVVRGMILAHSFPVAYCEKEVCFNQDLKAIVAGDQLVPEYLLATLLEARDRVLAQTSESSHGTKRLPTETLQRLLVALPPLDEQHAIAEALGDVDTLLLGLDQLIEKKRAVKQAVMEQLLTGRRRLPGFSEAWCECSLSEVVVSILGGGTPPRLTQSFWGGSIPWATVKDLSQFNPHGTQEYITPLGLAASASRLVAAGTLVLSTRMLIGKAVRFSVDVAINQDLKALVFDSSVAVEFMEFWFRLIQPRLELVAGGSTVKGLSIGQVLSLPVNLPPLPEQQAIAEVLTALDDELRALDERRAKTQHLKRGMMASLLSGKVRLR